MFWKNKKAENTKGSKIILGMVLLQDADTFDFDNFSDDFSSFYGYSIQKPTVGNSSFVFTVEEEMIAIAHMTVPIPLSDIEATAQYAYNWQTAVEDTKEHKGHLIVSLMKGGRDPIKRFKIFTKILCSLLRTTTSIGVYKGSQSLLIPKKDYLDEAELMSGSCVPINLWIYFGLRTTDQGKSVYTYGLKEFDKLDMEILNSLKSLADIRNFLLNITQYVLDNDVTFRDGQTCGLSNEERVQISISQGKFLDGETFKLAY